MGLFQPVAATLLLCVSHAVALYAPSSPVTSLDSSNFSAKLKTGVWMVEFYAPWYVQGLQFQVHFGLCICLVSVMRVAASRTSEGH